MSIIRISVDFPGDFFSADSKPKLLNTCKCRAHGALTLLVRQQEGHLASKNLGVGFSVVTFWLDFAWLIAAVVTITSVTRSSNKIQSGDILVPANPGPPGKWLLKRRERNKKHTKAWANTLDIISQQFLVHPAYSMSE